MCVLVVAYVLPPLLSWAAMSLIPARVQQWLPSVPTSLRPGSKFEVPTASSLLKVVGVAALVGGTYALLRRVLDAELTTFEPSVPGLHARSTHLAASRRARLLGSRFNHQVAQLYSHRVRWGYLAPLHRTFVADSDRLHLSVACASPADLNAALPFTNIVSRLDRGDAAASLWGSVWRWDGDECDFIELAPWGVRAAPRLNGFDICDPTSPRAGHASVRCGRQDTRLAVQDEATRAQHGLPRCAVGRDPEERQPARRVGLDPRHHRCNAR